MGYSGYKAKRLNLGCYVTGGIVGLVGIFLLVGFLGGISGYSEGIRIGTVDKFSKKGLFFKTWEGEMPLSGMESNGDGGMVARVFQFSVIDLDVVEAIKEAMEKGQRLKLVYDEYFIQNQAQMGTTYEIIKAVPIKVIKEKKQ